MRRATGGSTGRGQEGAPPPGSARPGGTARGPRPGFIDRPRTEKLRYHMK